MGKNTGRRRNNELAPHEIEIAAEPIELETLSYDEAVRLFIVDAERRALRPATIKYYQNETGMFAVG